MSNKKSFILHLDTLCILDELDDKQAGKLFKAIKAYQLRESVLNYQDVDTGFEGLMEDFVTRIAFAPFKAQFDRDNEEYQKTREINQDKGRLGNLKRWNKDLYDKVLSKEISLEEAENIAAAIKNRSSDKKSQQRQKIAGAKISSLNDSDSDSDNISFLKKETKSDFEILESLKNENSESPIETIQTPKEQSGGGRKRFTIPTPEEVQMYCDERKNGISGQQFCDFYSSKGWKVGSQPMKDWKAAVRTWEVRRKDTTPSITQSQAQISPPKRIRFDEYGNEIVY
jgi:hypothetical protein|nr:MAG TPA: hypothetical protein [Caudoviricetes sp.]